MSVPDCCLKSFKWDGNPVGRIGKLAANDAYITGDNADAAVMIVHDLLGWSFPNVRLLADHYAQEADVTVYVPDFYGGKALPFEPLLKGRFQELDVVGFLKPNGRKEREPEIFECARALRGQFKKVGAVGFCWGGWAVLRLGAEEHQPPLVDCVTAGHPSLLTKQDIDEVGVPAQMLAPEIDPTYTRELKLHTLETFLSKGGLAFDYQHFPGVEHACFTRGDLEKPGERAAMIRGKDCAVAWMRQFLHD